jgi:hypothetical protein
MGKNTVFQFTMIRRPEGTDLTIRSERIEQIMRSLSGGEAQEEYVGKPPRRNLDGLTASSARTIRTYRPQQPLDFMIAIDPTLYRECAVDDTARCASFGLGRPPVFRDHTMVHVNLSWLSIAGIGTGEGVQLQLNFPITLVDVRLCGQLMKVAAARLIEDYARPFSIKIKITEED